MRQYAKCVALAAGLMLSASAAQANFIGDEFSQYYYVPDTGTAYGQYTATNATVAAPFTGEFGSVEGVTTLNGDISATIFEIDFDTVLSSPTWGPASFSGLLFPLNTPSTLHITGFSVLPGTTLGDFDDSRVSVTPTTIGFNWQGLSYSSGDKLQVQFTFEPETAIPEPASIALLGAGLFGMGWGARRKRA